MLHVPTSFLSLLKPSPSARKVWMLHIREMGDNSRYVVAFRKEGVDAASCKEWGYGCGLVSPSARKVWMLQTVFVKQGWQEPVAFRKEGVDAALFALLVDVRLPAVAFRKEGVDAALPVMTLRFRLTGMIA